jgi:hypothetical protein
MTRIEHANLTVPDIDEAIKFISIVAPDFKVRRDEKPENWNRWVHIGNDEFYFALQESQIGASPEYPRKAYENFGVNHIALVVTNLGDIESNLVKAGYKRSIETPKEQFRKRLYFFDNFHFEWELIEYMSDIPTEKFVYE